MCLLSKVYYIPWVQFFKGSSFPTLFSMLPILRDIWIREDVSIVHGHGVSSLPCHFAVIGMVWNGCMSAVATGDSINCALSLHVGFLYDMP